MGEDHGVSEGAPCAPLTGGFGDSRRGLQAATLERAKALPVPERNEAYRKINLTDR